MKLTIERSSERGYGGEWAVVFDPGGLAGYGDTLPEALRDLAVTLETVARPPQAGDKEWVVVAKGRYQETIR